MSNGRILLTMASLVVVGGTLLSIDLPAPFWWLVPIALLICYQAVIVWGVMDLGLGMFANAICRVKTSKRQVALTFDDGPDPISTPLVLAALRSAGVKATFFVVGNKVERYESVIRQIAQDGHQIAIHSYRHELHYSFLSPKYVFDDIQRCREILRKCGVTPPNYFRPPVGQMSPRTARGMELAGFDCIGWSVRGGDGVAHRTAEDCLKRIRKGIVPGAILLLHDAWQGRDLDRELAAEDEAKRLACCPAGVRALPRLLDELARSEYECVTLEQLLAHNIHPQVEPESVLAP